jgi:hypothetical protein
LMVLWAFLLIGPWIVYAAHDWEIETDCDQVVRAPESFGFWMAFAALVSLPFALGAAVQERKWSRAVCLLGCLLSIFAIVVGVFISLGMQSTQVNCGGPPWPAST